MSAPMKKSLFSPTLTPLILPVDTTALFSVSGAFSSLASGAAHPARINIIKNKAVFFIYIPPYMDMIA